MYFQALNVHCSWEFTKNRLTTVWKCYFRRSNSCYLFGILSPSLHDLEEKGRKKKRNTYAIIDMHTIRPAEWEQCYYYNVPFKKSVLFLIPSILKGPRSSFQKWTCFFLIHTNKESVPFEIDLFVSFLWNNF